MSKGHIPGGGPASNKVVETSQRLGHRAKRHIVAGVAQQGQAQGSHVNSTEGGGHDTGYHGVAMRGSPFHVAGDGVKLGNEIADTTKCGPGGSRTVYKSGYQSKHGA
jgi:hypothetical protein